ncbi:DUF3800 domain-containing protein [Microbacterium sp. RG1]|uniref:DUF3800 domain-containing protein n=1 Tax=Microbacterium sp. RG1 TaxID=2489212 RepID=UPI0010CA419F|nr:DUF3800 domain-containing protein [Microbacterium sp. RG1]QCQ17250.1 DUF3800 domain-containing protein [Microbacterium sp. RG1]
MARNLDRLIYVDDSGRTQDGLIVYGWIEFHPDHWHAVLRAWLDLRKKLWREMGIPVTQELHSTDYINGRDRISKKIPTRYDHGGQIYWRDLGRDVALACLDTLRCAEGLRVGAVYRRDPTAGTADLKYAVYERFIMDLEEQMSGSESLAMIFMDGNGADPIYRRAHRTLRLSDRGVLEDALLLESASSQLVQMADLVAWCAYTAVDRYEKAEYAWNWYGDFLAERDRARAPREV